MSIPTQEHPARGPVETADGSPAEPGRDTSTVRDPDDLVVEVYDDTDAYDADEYGDHAYDDRLEGDGDVYELDAASGEARPARPRIDPRFRERRIEVIRAAGRRRLRITLVVTSVVVALGLGYLTVHSPLLDVDRIEVVGAHREPVTEILAAAGVHKGAPLLLVNTGAASHRIARLRWVAGVQVHRKLPGTLEYVVSEYVPTAYVRISPTVVALVAATGRVIGLSHAVPRHAVQVLGERATPVVGSVLASRAAANVLAQLPPHLASRVATVDVGGASVVLDLRAPAPRSTVCRGVPGAVAGWEQVRLGSLEALHAKGVAALAVINDLGGAPFTYVDASVPQAPVSC